MTTPTTTLTDRYVAAALRSIPVRDRAEIERELRALIGDAVEARIDAGAAPAAAEEAALVDLGDPEQLADRYRGGPQALIGPTRYGEWRRLLRTLLAVAVPAVAAVVAVAAVLGGQPLADVIGETVGAAFQVAVQVAFWTTLVFAVLERRPDPATDDAGRWTPADLPEVPAGSRVGLGDTVASVVMAAVTIAAMLWQRGAELVTVDGEAVPVLDPDHWSTWWPFLIAVLVADAVVSIAAFHRGRWSTGLAAAGIALDVAFAAVVLGLLATDRFFDPAFLAGLDWGEVDDPGTALGTAVGVGVVGVTLLSVWERARALVAGRRAEPADLT